MVGQAGGAGLIVDQLTLCQVLVTLHEAEARVVRCPVPEGRPSRPTWPWADSA